MMKKIGVSVQLGFPITNQPSERTSAGGRYASLTITDAASGECLAAVSLNPTEWLKFCSSEHILIDDAETSTNLNRVGMRRETKLVKLGYGASADTILAAMQQVKDEGWEAVQKQSSNQGMMVRCSRWVAEEAKTS